MKKKKHNKKKKSSIDYKPNYHGLQFEKYYQPSKLESIQAYMVKSFLDMQSKAKEVTYENRQI